MNALRIGDERDGQIVLCYNRELTFTSTWLLLLYGFYDENIVSLLLYHFMVVPDTCHFERLTSKGLENDGEYDFHWTTVPAAVGKLSKFG